jgi:hypothetical protein
MEIRSWIKAGERFEGRSAGGRLYLRFRTNDKVPTWRFRYRFNGKARVMGLGSYAELSLSRARDESKKFSARVALGHDVAGENRSAYATRTQRSKRKRMPTLLRSSPMSILNA